MKNNITLSQNGEAVMCAIRPYIVVKVRWEGLHFWPGCDIQSVSFLRDRHRHIFHIEIGKAVSHGDRDIEIIVFKRAVIACLDAHFPDRDMGSLSCEQLAEFLLKEFGASWVKVLEDGENGAEVRAEVIQ